MTCVQCHLQMNEVEEIKRQLIQTRESEENLRKELAKMKKQQNKLSEEVNKAANEKEQVETKLAVLTLRLTENLEICEIFTFIF